MTLIYTWRGVVTNDELNRLHAEAFGTRVYSADEWDWVDLLNRHSLGWVVAREGDGLVGFVNVLWTASCMPGCRTRWWRPVYDIEGSETKS